MKIEVKDGYKLFRLGEVKFGDCFSCDGEYYMVTDEVVDHCIKVVNLSTGETEKWGNGTMVVLVDARVVVG